MKVEGYFSKVGESSGDEPWHSTFLYFALLCSTFLNFVFSRLRLVLGYGDLNTYFPPQTPKNLFLFGDNNGYTFNKIKDRSPFSVSNCVKWVT